MQKLKKITEHPVIAGIILLILSSISYAALTEKLTQWFDYIIELIIIAFYFVIGVLTHEVAAWKIIVFLITIIGIFSLYIKIRISQENKNISVVSTTESENKILKLLEKHYGQKSLNTLEIARALNTKDIAVIEQIIESLFDDKKLLERYENYFDGTTFTLNKRGRDYVVTNRGELT